MLIRVFLHAENHTIFMKNAQNYSFYPKFVHFSEIVLQNFIFSVKSTIFYISGPNVHFIQNLYILVKFFWQKLHF